MENGDLIMEKMGNTWKYHGDITDDELFGGSII